MGILKSISCISTSIATSSLFLLHTMPHFVFLLSPPASLSLSLATEIRTNPFVNKIFPTKTKVELVGGLAREKSERERFRL
jgi:hypothetical protein